MKYKTITFDANKPIAQQITEPTNSEYGIAVKAYKNDKVVDPSKVSISNVEKAKETEDGWSLYKLSSDGNEGMKTVEVQMTEGGGGGGVSYTKSVEGYETYLDNATTETFWHFGANELSASDGSSLPETLTLDARKITGSFVATGTDGYFLSSTLPQEVDGFCSPMVVSHEGTRYLILYNDGEYNWASPDDDTHTMSIVGPTLTISTGEKDYAEIAGCILYYDGTLHKQIDISLNANISFGTDDLSNRSGGSSETIKFPLYVQQKDMGYIEVESISSSGDIK